MRHVEYEYGRREINSGWLLLAVCLPDAFGRNQKKIEIRASAWRRLGLSLSAKGFAAKFFFFVWGREKKKV